MIVVKLRGARERVKANAGRCEGRKPYSFYEGKTETLQLIQVLHSDGVGYDRIAERLNAEGRKARTGTRWHGLVVNRIVSRAG